MEAVVVQPNVIIELVQQLGAPIVFAGCLAFVGYKYILRQEKRSDEREHRSRETEEWIRTTLVGLTRDCTAAMDRMTAALREGSHETSRHA